MNEVSPVLLSRMISLPGVEKLGKVKQCKQNYGRPAGVGY